jgi:hypothetical protein
MTLASIAGTVPQASSGLPLPDTLPVPWLNFVAKDGGVGSIGLSSVYRVQVAGGEPPATCENITGTTIQTQYSALYAFFGPANSTSPSTVSTSTSSSTPTTLVTVSTPTASASVVAGAPCATNGQLACNGSSYGQCVDSIWVIRQCGSGTLCVPNGQSLYCGTAPATTSS